MGLETKNYYAGEGQQQFNRATEQGSQTLPVAGKQVPFQNMKKLIFSLFLMGSNTKKDCAGEGQRPVAGLNWTGERNYTTLVS
jgi:hypothetical protein